MKANKNIQLINVNLASIEAKILDNLIWVILLLLFLVNSVFIPHFCSMKNLLNILYHSTPLAILALAQATALASGNFDLSIESTLAISVAIPGIMMNSLELNPYLAICFVLLSGIVIGSINGFLVVKVGVNPFLVTLSTLIVLRGLMLYLVPKTIYGFPNVFTYLGGASYFGIPIAVLTVLVIYLTFYFFSNYLKFFRELLATGGNKDAAFSAGIDVDRIIFLTFILSGLLASIAGLIMAGRLESVTNNMGEGMVFMSFAAAVMGGINLQGGVFPVIGVFGGFLFLGTIDNTLCLMHVSPYIVYALKGVFILVAIILDHFKTTVRTHLLS